MADVYLHWLLVLALDRLGIASASLDTLGSDDPVVAALKPDLVLSDAGSAAGSLARTVAISREWAAETMRLPVLNIGGEKFSPQAFEDMALGCAGIRDAAAFSVPDRFGVETPFIAVVRGADHQPGGLMAS